MGSTGGYFQESDVILQMAAQSGFGVLPSSGILVPIKAGSEGPGFEQDLIENEARTQHGYRLRSVLGQPNNGAELPLVANFNAFGYPLYGLCGASMAESGAVVDIALTNNGGLGYADGAVVVTIAAPGGGGTTATATATATGGKVQKPVIVLEGTNYTVGAPPVVTIAAPGGGGTTATATATVRLRHAGKPQIGVLPWYTLQETVGADHYQHLDQIFTEFKFDYDLTGHFDPTFTTVGSGDTRVAGTSLDTTPTAVAGVPASKLNWGAIEDGVDEGIITKASITIKRDAIDVRASGRAGKGVDIFGGNIMVDGTITCWYKGDTRLAKTRNGILTSQKHTITSGFDRFVLTLPELEAKPTTKTKKEKGKAISFDLEVHGIFDVSVSSPCLFELYNTVVTHATT